MIGGGDSIEGGGGNVVGGERARERTCDRGRGGARGGHVMGRGHYRGR